MRGFPGCGKSTLVKQIVAHFAQTASQPAAIVCSADDYFIDGATQQYVFDPEKLTEAHGQCFQTFVNALESQVPLVIVDNTNLQHWHYQQYLDYINQHPAIQQRLTTLIVEVQLPNIKHLTHGQLSSIDICQYRNTHRVNRESLIQGLKNYQAERSAIRVTAVLTLDELYAVRRWKAAMREQQRTIKQSGACPP